MIRQGIFEVEDCQEEDLPRTLRLQDQDLTKGTGQDQI